MAIDIDDVIAEQSPESRAYIAGRSQEIVEEVLSPPEVRKIVDCAEVELRAS